LWYEWLQKQGYKNIFIAGHSEGSMIGLLLSQIINPAGLISIAGAGRTAKDIFIEQLTPQLTPSDIQYFKTAADSLIAGHTVKHVPDNMQSLLRQSVQPYLRSWFIHDPKILISRVKCPVLILQGTEDIQVTEVDSKLLKEGKAAADLVVIKGMNHVLKIVELNNRAANINAYSDPTLPLSNELVTSVVSFITKSTKKK
jgi:pimeloyl-ACP methyl ester carboxylesterase